MGFAINPSLNFIDLPQQYIIELYRSSGEILLPDARFRGHPCEAFICISKVEKTQKAYVALLEMGVKSVFIYTSDYTTDNSADYPKVIAEAEEFTRAMGFTMERVNLDFSPAMREVIIKGFRVMRAPAKKAPARSTGTYTKIVPTVEMLPPPPPANKAVLSNQKISLTPELKSLQTQLASAKAVIEKVTREKLSFEQNATSEITALKASVETAAESKRLCEEKLTKEIEALKRARGEAATNRQEEFAKALQAELDTMRLTAKRAGDSHKNQVASLLESIKALENEKLQLGHELSAEKSSSTENIAKLTAEMESISALLASEKIAAADKIASLTLLETSWQEGKQREEDLCLQINQMKQQLEALAAERAKHLEEEGREAALMLKIAAMENEVAASRAEIERFGSSSSDQAGLEAEIKCLAEAKNSVEAEYVRMANETMNKEAEMLEALYTAEAEIVRLSRELEVRHKVDEMEKSALREELKQMILSGSPPAYAGADKPPTAVSPETFPPPVEKVSPLRMTTVQPDSEDSADISTATVLAAPPSVPAGEAILPPDSAEADTTDAPIAGDPEVTQGMTNEFGNFCGSSGYSTTEFTIALDISVIEYSDPGEVVVIISSSNTVQAVPDGNNIQRCKGYVIATKNEGAYKAYVAWYLTESSKVVICTPDQQPADAHECTRILQDAVAYFEIVGFMMELEDLGSTVKSYNRAIKRVPALSRT